MSPRALRILVVPEEVDDAVDFPVSRRKLAEFVRRSEQFGEVEKKLEETQGELKNAREKIEDLKRKLERAKNSLTAVGADAKTAAAAGVPSSKTFFPRPRPSPDERRAPGGQPGHPGKTRERPVPNAPPVVLSLKTCPHCKTPLGDPCDSSSHPVIDLPEPSLLIFLLTVHRYKCGGCGERVHAEIPEAFRGDFGPRVKTVVATLRVMGVPLGKIVEFLETTWKLHVSVATALSWERGVAASVDDMYQELREEIRTEAKTPAAEGDETSFPINGAKWWMWVGTSARTTVYTIQPTRSHEEALALWGGYTGGLTRDGYAAYNWVTTAEHQMDLVHVNRWLQKVEVKHHIEPRGFLRAKRPRFLRAGRPPKESLTFAKGVRARLASEVRWTKRYREASQKARERRYRRAVRSMGRFLAHPWKDPDAKRIAKETGDRLGILYTFVRDPRVSWNSNGAEREVRAGAVYRKISGGRRTVDGGALHPIRCAQVTKHYLDTRVGGLGGRAPSTIGEKDTPLGRLRTALSPDSGRRKRPVHAFSHLGTTSSTPPRSREDLTTSLPARASIRAGARTMYPCVRRRAP